METVKSMKPVTSVVWGQINIHSNREAGNQRESWGIMLWESQIVSELKLELTQPQG